DGKPDLVWQNDTTHEVSIWYMGGTQGNVFLGWAALNASPIPGSKVVATGDFNGDGQPDLVWQNNARQLTVWYMGGAQGDVFQASSWLSSSGVVGWSVVGTADFNEDGKPDIVWQNDSTREITVWYMGGPQGDALQGWNWLASTGVAG